MDVVVVFKFPDITDPDSDAATDAVTCLSFDLKNAGIDCDTWFIDEVIGEPSA